MERVGYLNGEFVPQSQMLISVEDRGFHFGDTVYDVERTFNGQVFRLREHMERLYRSLAAVRMDPGLGLKEMERLTLEVVERNEPLREPGGDYVVRQFVTRGCGASALDQAPPTVGIFVSPINFTRFAPLFKKGGAHVVFPRTRSYPPEALDPKVKHYSRMNFVLAELEAADVDPEAFPVLLDTEGNITEHVRMNFFLLTNGVLRSPRERAILQGISRMTVLELAKNLGIPTVEEDLQPYHAYTADEAFLTSTQPCILPVGRIDNRPLRQQAPGPVVQQLLAAWSELVGVDIVGQVLSHG
ncbi:MAG: aminotransferase class IV [Dehalococcoidia bacterium]